MKDVQEEARAIAGVIAMLIGAEPFQTARYYRVVKDLLGYSDEKVKGAPVEKVLRDLGDALAERGYVLDVRPRGG